MVIALFLLLACLLLIVTVGWCVAVAGAGFTTDRALVVCSMQALLTASWVALVVGMAMTVGGVR